MVLRFLTSGESHGKALTAIIEGVPSGFRIDFEKINKELARRQKGYGRGGRMLIEQDKVIPSAGIRLGYTLGSPICFTIENKDWVNWEKVMSYGISDDDLEQKKLINDKYIKNLRPGHADYPGALKFDHYDLRNILERSSARNTATQVAVGALAKQILEEFGIEIVSHVTTIGKVSLNAFIDDYNAIKSLSESSDVRCICEETTQKMKKHIDEAKELGESLGGMFQIVVLGLPVGLGSHVHWDKKLDGQLAQAIMSIQAIKAIGFGLGEKVANDFGSNIHDEFYPKDGYKIYKRGSNNAGGIEGGMSNGMPVVINASMKPIPTMLTPLNSVNIDTGEAQKAHYERSDVCAVPAAAVVGEAMTAIIILNSFLEKFGGDSLKEIKHNYNAYKLYSESR